MFSRGWKPSGWILINHHHHHPLTQVVVYPGGVCALSTEVSSSTSCHYCLLDVETVQHFLTDCAHWSRESRLCGITDCDAYVILHGNNIADIKNLLKFVRLTRRLKWGLSIQWSRTGSKSYVFARIRAFGLDPNKPSSSSLTQWFLDWNARAVSLVMMFLCGQVMMTLILLYRTWMRTCPWSRHGEGTMTWSLDWRSARWCDDDDDGLLGSSLKALILAKT